MLLKCSSSIICVFAGKNLQEKNFIDLYITVYYCEKMINK
jgi:hypothetical protein